MQNGNDPMWSAYEQGRLHELKGGGGGQCIGRWGVNTIKTPKLLNNSSPNSLSSKYATGGGDVYQWSAVRMSC